VTPGGALPGASSKMATNLENLNTTLATLIEKLTEAVANPKPSYSLDGQSVSWGDYYRMLTEQIKAVREQIQMEDPYFLTSQVM
jgi:hypothetical protein